MDKKRIMNAQIPAQGILINNDWGDAKAYEVVCGCGDHAHSHNVWVEAEDSYVTVTVYTTVKSDFWSKTRFKQIWDLLVNGYVKYESSIIMSEQQAFNYAETLKSAVNDSKDFSKKRSKRNGTSRQSMGT
jgi:hypothetical protein